MLGASKCLIFISIITTEFSLIDSSGNTVGAGTQGLLISNGGTVCDDSFSDNSADAICRKMGHYGHTSFSSGNKWDIQSVHDIKLDDVACDNGYWSSCSFSKSHNCGHSEDVFLQCAGVGKLLSSSFIIVKTWTYLKSTN